MSKNINHQKDAPSTAKIINAQKSAKSQKEESPIKEEPSQESEIEEENDITVNNAKVEASVSKEEEDDFFKSSGLAA